MHQALVIRGGTVVNADREQTADLLCVDGRIVALGADAAAQAPAGAQTLDASGPANPPPRLHPPPPHPPPPIRRSRPWPPTASGAAGPKSLRPTTAFMWPSLGGASRCTPTWANWCKKKA